MEYWVLARDSTQLSIVDFSVHWSPLPALFVFFNGLYSTLSSSFPIASLVTKFGWASLMGWRTSSAVSVSLKADCRDVTFSGHTRLSRQNSFLSFVIRTDQESTSSETKHVLDSAPWSFTPSLTYFAPLFFESIRQVTVCLQSLFLSRYFYNTTEFSFCHTLVVDELITGTSIQYKQ